MQTSDERPSKRARKACTECRQQKARCDAYLAPGEPCSRCRKMRVQCVISDPFKREHKRKKLSELEHEAAALRKRLEGAAAPPNADNSPASPDTVLTTSQSPVTNGHTQRLSLNTLAKPLPLVSAGPAQFRETTPALQFRPSLEDPTTSQELDGVKLEGSTIDGVFLHYFETFARFLPILDPSRSPNSYCSENRLLFWSIIGVASRTYQDANLVGALAPKIINLACISLQYNAKQSTLPIIKAFILLLTWPFPRGTHDTEISFPFAGALIHMALQIGLHIPAASQDFSRVKVKLTQEDITNRCELWAYCVLAYQRSCSQIGQYPASSFDRSYDLDRTLHERISRTLSFQLYLHRLERRFCSAMQDIGLLKMTLEKENHLDILIRVFEAQLKDVEPQIVTEIDRFFFLTTRHVVTVFHFFKSSVSQDLPAGTRIYATACAVIEQFQMMEQKESMDLSASPGYYSYGLLMATTSLIRLLKSSFGQFIDAEIGKAAVFAGFEIAKKLSAGHRDLASKFIPVISQLWNSDRAFKKPDGTEFVALRIRTRMMMSPVYDALWWWREEFGGQAGAYPPSTDEEQQQQQQQQLQQQQQQPGGSIDTAVPSEAVIDPQAMDPGSIWFGFMEPYYFPNDQTFAEIGWTGDYNLNGTLGGEITSSWTS